MVLPQGSMQREAGKTMNPVKFSLRYPAVTLIITAMVVVVGLYAFFKMPRSEDPSITIHVGLVLAQYPGATSEQVEKQVTKVLEKHIFKFPEVRKEKTFSTSRPGLVVINVQLVDYITNTDLFWAKLRNELNEMRAAELPAGVRGPVVNSNFGDTIATLIAVHGKRYGYRELRDYVENIQDELRTIPAVGKMERYGEQSEQIWITGSLARISQYVIDPMRMITALRQHNVIGGSGSLDAGQSKVPLRTTGLFSSEEQIGNVLVDISKTGQPVYIRDLARVERRYQDPVFLTRYNGEPSVLLSVEMKKKGNIAELGDSIAEVLSELKLRLPPDIELDLITNQPAVVKDRMTRLSYEFLLAIGAVILVTILLLPIRVAVIAALAIPVTLCATLGAMNALGIYLHQISIAALIMVIGIVVDDAIVITDNYVELLDRKVPKAEASWRSAMDVVVPVFTATVTIICSFLPLATLTDSVGEFIQDLPKTVAIALSVSFIVAVMLTPILCRFFIRKGLHSREENRDKKKSKTFSVLETLQNLYQRVIVYFMRRKTLTLALGIGAVCLGLFLFKFVPQEFFPPAERNQFVIDVWARQGTRIEATDAIMRRIEKNLSGRPEISHYASFVGQSGPRFYYNVNPQQPDSAYGQIIVNTQSIKVTKRLVSDLSVHLAELVPEAMIVVKELQQGIPMEAPVEVRISGDDMGELKRLASEIEGIITAVPFSQFVHRDCFNDSYMVDVNVDNELSNRLGLTNASISTLLSGAFDGAPVSTFWEGDRAATMLLRLEQENRSSFADVNDTYVTSAITHAAVPLRSVASLKPEWQTSRIVHRNGVRTLTVRSFVKQGYFASALLKTVGPKISAIKLPPGYRIEYGGEYYNEKVTLPQMVVALGISLIAIFLVLLIQFRCISEPLIVMSSIPLLLLGASFGLIITRNSFGFMALVGITSLCGIVVRNAIILIDCINEKIAQGQSVEQAATEAGQRRLRPIFLTSMAAAVGVTPMIFGSNLWSPLASVIAVGLIFSMFFTLLVVPVLFVIVRSRTYRTKSTAAVGVLIVAVLIFGSGAAQAAETKRLTLPEAMDLALTHNSALKIARARVGENREKVKMAHADYFPHLSNDTTYTSISNKQLVTIPAGSLGTVPGLGPFPIHDVPIDQGSNSLLVNTTTLSQPLTQLLKINEAEHIALADQGIAEADLRKAEADITFAVRRLYYGLLIAYKQKEAAEASIEASKEGLKDSEKAVEAGNMLDVAVVGSRVLLLQDKQALLSAEIQISDITAQMNDLLGLPLDTLLIPVDGSSADSPARPREEYLKDALLLNPEVAAAQKNVKKAASAVNAATYEYIPDIGLFGRHIYQDGVPFVDRNITVFGVQMTWNIFDWGKRQAGVGQRRQQLVQATENLHRVERQVEVEVDKAYRKLEQTKMIVAVAREALSLQQEKLRLSGNGLTAGTVNTAKYAESVASLKKAQCDETQALLGVELALAELKRLSGAPVR